MPLPVPKDIAIVGFDDIPAAAEGMLPLTAITDDKATRQARVASNCSFATHRLISRFSR